MRKVVGTGIDKLGYPEPIAEEGLKLAFLNQPHQC